MTDNIQRCTKCFQPWNGLFGSACNQCKMLAEQQKQTEMLNQRATEIDYRDRERSPESQRILDDFFRMYPDWRYPDDPEYKPERDIMWSFILSLIEIAALGAVLLWICYLLGIGNWE